MKLIDLLVQELPKRGGWPEDSDSMCQSGQDNEIYTNSHILKDFYVGVSCDDSGIENYITPKQYEMALKQSAWNGEGIPPVGTECEFREQHVNEWRRGVVSYISKYTIVVDISPEEDESGDKEPCYENDGNLLFRPIRTETDRKRNKFAESLADKSVMGEQWQMQHVGRAIYDAIASGKIRGVKLDD